MIGNRIIEQMNEFNFVRYQISYLTFKDVESKLINFKTINGTI